MRISDIKRRPPVTALGNKHIVVSVRLSHGLAELTSNWSVLQVDIWIIRRDDFEERNANQDDKDQNACEQKGEERLTYAAILP